MNEKEKEELKKEVLEEIKKEAVKVISELSIIAEKDISDLRENDDKLLEYINRLRGGVESNVNMIYEMFEILRTKGL